MDEKYIADKADFVAVADAIREKAGTSDELSFPAGFVEAVGGISGGIETVEVAISPHKVTLEVQYMNANGEAASIVTDTRTTITVMKNSIMFVDLTDNCFDLDYDESVIYTTCGELNERYTTGSRSVAWLVVTQTGVLYIDGD